eukprot:g6368.t1
MTTKKQYEIFNRFLREFEENYELGNVLGSGSFSTVYMATRRSTGDQFAVKIMKKSFEEGYLSKHCVNHIQHEVDILNKLGPSLNVAYLYGVYESDEQVQLVMELCSGGPMLDCANKATYSERDAARIVRDMLRAIAQCHSKGIVMRDVKPENFLFLNDKTNSPLKAIDFGLARYCSATGTLKSRAGTPLYIAPEVLRRAYGQSADLWSAGVIAYQLLTGRMPFLNEQGEAVSRSLMERHLYTNKDMFRSVLYSKLDFSSKTWSGLTKVSREFVKSLLRRDPRHRPTALEALEHKWFYDGLESNHVPLDSSIVQRLQRFGTYGKLKQAALKKVATYVIQDPYLMKDLKAGFFQLDKRGNGRVASGEIVKLLNDGGFDMSAAETQQLLAQVQESSNGGFVDYSTWLAAVIDWKQLQESPVWETWIQEVFKSFDFDHQGKLTREELTQILCGGNCKIPDTVPSVLREVDTDGDGLVSLEDFLKVMDTESSDSLDLFDDRHHIDV